MLKNDTQNKEEMIKNYILKFMINENEKGNGKVIETEYCIAKIKPKIGKSNAVKNLKYISKLYYMNMNMNMIEELDIMDNKSVLKRISSDPNGFELYRLYLNDENESKQNLVKYIMENNISGVISINIGVLEAKIKNNDYEDNSLKVAKEILNKIKDVRLINKYLLSIYIRR